MTGSVERFGTTDKTDGSPLLAKGNVSKVYSSSLSSVRGSFKKNYWRAVTKPTMGGIFRLGLEPSGSCVVRETSITVSRSQALWLAPMTAFAVMRSAQSTIVSFYAPHLW